MQESKGLGLFKLIILIVTVQTAFQLSSGNWTTWTLIIGALGAAVAGGTAYLIGKLWQRIRKPS